MTHKIYKGVWVLRAYSESPYTGNEALEDVLREAMDGADCCSYEMVMEETMTNRAKIEAETGEFFTGFWEDDCEP